MPSAATITSVTGPAITNTSLVFSPLARVEFDFIAETLKVTTLDNKVTNYDITADGTFTLTVSGINYTLTVS